MQDSLLTAWVHSNYLSSCTLHVSKIHSHGVIHAVTKLCAREIVTASMAVKNIHCAPQSVNKTRWVCQPVISLLCSWFLLFERSLRGQFKTLVQRTPTNQSADVAFSANQACWRSWRMQLFRRLPPSTPFWALIGVMLTTWLTLVILSLFL